MVVFLPEKLPFGLRSANPFMPHHYNNWLLRRTNNIHRKYMSKIYIMRNVQRELRLILLDSGGISITDNFWIRYNEDLTWEKIRETRDRNMRLADAALTGTYSWIEREANKQGMTSLFTTKGTHPKAIVENTMLKIESSSKYEWVATVIGRALGISVQDVNVLYPNFGNVENIAEKLPKSVRPKQTLVEIPLFTSEKVSLVHASEVLPNLNEVFPNEANSRTQEVENENWYHRYFYDSLPDEKLKREFERILILNWLISNHDMHLENFGCLYDPATFRITGIAPSFDHNSAAFDGLAPGEDVPGIVIPNIGHHEDIIAKIEAGCLETALEDVRDWLSPSQKECVRNVGKYLTDQFRKIL